MPEFRNIANPLSSIKVGFFGGMANNAYVAAKSAHDLGYDAIYIRDLADQFPFSQPIWEDARFTLPYDDIHNRLWNRAEWEDLEKKYSWASPAWVKSPHTIVEKLSISSFIQSNGVSIKSVLSWLYLRRAGHRPSVVALMRDCDALFVCGVEAEILAWCSGVPYVIWPHGGDIRLASGLVPYKGKNLREFASYWINRFYLNCAYRSAIWIGTHDAKGITGDMGTVAFALEHLPIPVPSRSRPITKQERHILLRKTCNSLGISIPDADYYFFIPSRVSFFWKKTHLLLNAIRSLSKDGRCHFIFSGWGEDYHNMLNLTPKDCTTFLPCSISKPIIFDLFRSVDLVIDQFSLGTYGTASVEAMSCQAPVMMYLEDRAFKDRNWSPPPVLNARNENEVTRILTGILNGDIDLEKSAADLHAWFLRVHHDKVVIPAFYKALNNRISNIHKVDFKRTEPNQGEYDSIRERKIQS